MSWDMQAPERLALDAAPAQRVRAAIASARSLARLEALSKAVWLDFEAQRLDDAQAQSLAEAIEARRRQVRGLDTVANRAPAVAAATQAQGRPSCFPPKRKAPSSPDRSASLERRRLLATSGVMPAAMAARFTVGELAALGIVRHEVLRRGDCRVTLAAIAARAGVGLTTARNALREAARQGLILIEERRRPRQPNLPNVVRIISRDWLAWIERGPKRTAAYAPLQKQAQLKRRQAEGGGCKKTGPTDTHYLLDEARGRSRPSRSPPWTPDESAGRSFSAH